MAKQATVSEQLRTTILESGESMLSVARAAEIDKGSMSRFLSGQRGLRLDAIDRLCLHFGLRLVATSKAKGAKR